MIDASARLAEALAGAYRIERELGAGGMATVYLAYDLRHDRNVAIKVLRPELAAVLGAERFLAEIRTTANLQHPHILPLFDSGAIGESGVFYVMPYVEGESLRDRLDRERQLPVEDAVRIAGEVAGALDYAHRHGVVHRDIKPENILLHDGSALVADFGIALAMSRSDGAARMTETGLSLGTPFYMSPEQAMGEREIGPRSDVYALGAVTYEMLSGEPPFTGPTAQAIVARVMTEEPRSLTLQRKSVPPHLEAAVMKALEKLPADRFASASQLAESLSHATSAWAAPHRPGSRRWLAAAPWGVAVAATALAAAAWLHRPRPRGTSWAYAQLTDSIPITTDIPSLALSPDGQELAVKDNRQDGLIWIKRRDQLEPTPIPGTERGSGMAFSPDGDWIAFIADSHVRKIRVSGGPAVTLADSAASADLHNVAWLGDSALVYASGLPERLMRIGADGGAPSVVMADSSLHGFGLVNLEPLPDARGVLFAAPAPGGLVGVHVLDLGTRRQKLLVADAVAAWYLPTGDLLYLRADGTGLAVPFDLRKLAITGPAVPVLQNIFYRGAGSALLAVSPSGTLAYLRATGAPNNDRVVRVRRDGTAAPVDPAWFGAFDASALSPDGRQLAIGAISGVDTRSIWIKQLDHGTFSRLTFSGRDRRPAWSPDGKLVSFVRDAYNGGDVYARAADGSGTDRRLGHIDRAIQELAWSPDGRWLVVRTDNGEAGVGDLVAVPVGGNGEPVPLVATGFSELEPAVSPDSRWIAYVSNESGSNEVYVRGFPDVSGGRWQVSNGGGIGPRWSPDGRELFYLDPANRRLVAAEVRTAPAFAVVGLHPLFDISGFIIDPFHPSYDVEPGARSFLFIRQRGASGSTTPRLVMAENWFADVRARMRR